jgi:hypothetical protein
LLIVDYAFAAFFISFITLADIAATLAKPAPADADAAPLRLRLSPLIFRHGFVAIFAFRRRCR